MDSLRNRDKYSILVYNIDHKQFIYHGLRGTKMRHQKP